MSGVSTGGLQWSRSDSSLTWVSQARFIFLSTLMQGEPDGPGEGVFWLLVSSNIRQLGRGRVVYRSYQDCRDATLYLRRGLGQAKTATAAAAAEGSGQWVWRVDLRGSAAAVSSRSYFQVRECQYNLGRFLAAVPHAPLVDGVRMVRHARQMEAQPR